MLLTDLEEIKKIDPQGTYESTDLFVKQCETAWKEVNELDISSDYSRIKNMIFCGMGASIYGALVLKALEGKTLNFPTEYVSDYHLPQYVNSETLVVLTSYSGTTEEVLSCAQEALERNAKMVILTKGGPLAEFAKKHSIPSYIFDGKLNPAGVPRLGNGYSILGLIGLLNKLELVVVEAQEITDAITRLKGKQEEIKTQAMNDSQMYVNKIPIIFAAEHLSGNAQILRNQFNETSKTFSAFYLIPDLNHHLMEGLQFPKHAPLQFLLLNTRNYEEKIAKRVALTKKVIEQNHHIINEFHASGQTLYDDVLETIMYGSYITLFLGLTYKINPATNPWVDYFKTELSK